MQLLLPKEQTRLILIEMGYNNIPQLFEKHREIENVEDALLLLEKTQMGYRHTFFREIV